MNALRAMRQWSAVQWLYFVSMILLLGLTLAIAGLGCQAPASAADNVTSIAAPKDIVDPIKVWLNGDHGIVTIRVRVNADGRVVRVLSNSASDQVKPLYERIAKRWVFLPATRDGHPVASDVTIRFRYTVTSTYTLLTDQ